MHAMVQKYDAFCHAERFPTLCIIYFVLPLYGAHVGQLSNLMAVCAFDVLPTPL